VLITVNDVIILGNWAWKQFVLSRRALCTIRRHLYCRFYLSLHRVFLLASDTHYISTLQNIPTSYNHCES